MRRRLQLILLLTAPFAAALSLPAVADAGTYKVYSCKTPTGRVAPTDGWGSFQDGGAFSAPSNDCAMGGPMDGYLNGDFAQASGDRIGWRYVLPSNLSLVGFRLWRSFSTTAAAEQNATPYAYVSWPSPDFTPDARAECVAAQGCTQRGTPGSSLAAADVVEYGGLDLQNLWVMAGCGGGQGCVDRNSTTAMARAQVKAFEAHLRDADAPVATNPQGRLAADVVHSGSESLAFDASDSGSGVYRAVFEVKREGTTTWEPVATENTDPTNTECADADPSNGDPYEFLFQIPCKRQLGANVTLDTTKIPNGSHELRVMIEDASGNRTTVLQPGVFKVSNANAAGLAGGLLGAPVNGAGASNQARITVSKQTRRAAKRLRFGQRYRLVATIRNERGEPISGATVDVLQRIKLPGARYQVARKPIVTGRRGQVRWTVPAGASRAIQLAYKANLLNTTYQAATLVPLDVSAKTTLRRNRSSFRNGQTIRFTGKVRSKPIPKGGVLIDLQAYKRGAGWVTFATKRSGKNGRWRVNYRLNATTTTVRYRFRARVRQDSGYPFSAGRSKTVSVLVRP